MLSGFVDGKARLLDFSKEQSDAITSISTEPVRGLVLRAARERLLEAVSIVWELPAAQALRVTSQV